VLSALGLRPDDLAHHDRAITQAIARRLHALGAWHTTVVFIDRERAGEVGSLRHAISG